MPHDPGLRPHATMPPRGLGRGPAAAILVRHSFVPAARSSGGEGEREVEEGGSGGG
jgi:hypothetical protein